MAFRQLFVQGALAALAGTVILLPSGGADASAALPAGCAASAGTVTCDFGYTGSPQSFTVPAGVTQVTFSASGAAGAAGGFKGTPPVSPTLAPGGLGTVVSTTVTVTPAAVYTLRVGGSPTTSAVVCGSGVDCLGGYNGGANGGSGASGLLGGGGGGASDVRDSQGNPVVVAGGGGGGGAGTVSPDGATGAAATEIDGGTGGDAGDSGSGGSSDGDSPPPAPGGGGGAGTNTVAGVGGAPSGADGAGSTGGAGALSSGGGGGGGYYGGGGGGAGAVNHADNNRASSAGGGGGGSWFTASGEPPSGTNDGAGEVKVTFALSAPTLSTHASASVAVGGSISDTATVTGGSAPTGQVRFDVYGPDDATCTGTVASTSTTDLSTAGGTVSATSTAFTPTAAGTYQFVAHYLGDATDGAVDGRCGDSGESVVVSAAQSTPTTTPTTRPPSTTPTATPSTPSTGVTTTGKNLAYTGASVGPIAALGAAAISGGACLILIATARRRRRGRQH